MSYQGQEYEGAYDDPSPLDALRRMVDFCEYGKATRPLITKQECIDARAYIADVERAILSARRDEQFEHVLMPQDDDEHESYCRREIAVRNERIAELDARLAALDTPKGGSK